MADDIQSRIEEIVKGNKIVLFMKGTPSFPQCGFSNRATQILTTTGKPFESVDVIGQPEFRQAIKEYSDWPTIPQVYIGGELLGGSDILMQMYESGQLDEVVDKAFAEE
jgi:monothiol glutaredoxin